MVKAPKNNSWLTGRSFGTLESPKNIYIFCEGKKTEPNYFIGLSKHIDKAIYQDKIHVEPIGTGMNTSRVFEEAKKFIEKNKINNAIVWCVFDKDDFKKSKFDNVENACRDKTNDNNKKKIDVVYKAAWSNQCVELWFLLHFEYHCTASHRKDYIKELNHYFQSSLLHKKYKKNNPNIFDDLLSIGNPAFAIKNANRLEEENIGNTPSHSDPCTKVHIILEDLLKYLSEDIKKKFK